LIFVICYPIIAIVNFEKEIFMRFIRRKEVEHITGLSRSTIYVMVGDGTFPKQVRLGAKAVGWYEDDIKRWMEERREVSSLVM